MCDVAQAEQKKGAVGGMSYNRYDIRNLKKTIKAMEAGETIFINAVNLTANGIELLRSYVKNGVLVPDRKEVEARYKDVEAVMSGAVVFPQMIYTKQQKGEKQQDTGRECDGI